jgi:hypothetical protein
MGLAYCSVIRPEDELLSKACNDVLSTNSVTILIYISLLSYWHGRFNNLEEPDDVWMVHPTDDIHLCLHIFLFIIVSKFSLIVSFYGYYFSIMCLGWPNSRVGTFAQKTTQLVFINTCDFIVFSNIAFGPNSTEYSSLFEVFWSYDLW